MKLLTEEVLRMTFLSNYDKSKTLSEQTIPGGISQQAYDKIIAFSDKNKETSPYSNPNLTLKQAQEIDKEFGADTYSKFYQNGGKSILKTVEKQEEKPQEQGKKLPEIPLPNGVSQQAVDKIIAISKKNKETLRGSYLFPPQQQSIDAEFGTGTYSKFFYNGGEEVLKGEKVFKKQTTPEPIPATDPWTKYQCVVNHPNAKKTKDTSGGIVYLINGVYYYGNGRKRLKNGTMAPYTCKSPEFITKKQAPEIPKDLDGVEGVKAFQNWLDDNHGDDNKGQGKGWATGLPDGKLSQAGGYGRFGPRTSAAWKLYKTEYLNRGNSKNVVDDNTGNPYGEYDTDEDKTTTPVNTNEPPQD
jgi:hypothetical protein